MQQLIGGVPSRVRSDKGGENKLVWEQMIEIRGENRGRYLAAILCNSNISERLSHYFLQLGVYIFGTNSKFLFSPHTQTFLFLSQQTFCQQLLKQVNLYLFQVQFC